MARCPRCRSSATNVATCTCGQHLVAPAGEDRRSLDQRDRQARAALPPWKRMIPRDLTLESFAFASLFGIGIACVEFPFGLRLLRTMHGDSGIPVVLAIYFAVPILILLVARMAAGRVRGLLRFLALASLLGAMGCGIITWLFVQGMGAMRFG